MNRPTGHITTATAPIGPSALDSEKCGLAGQPPAEALGLHHLRQALGPALPTRPDGDFSFGTFEEYLSGADMFPPHFPAPWRTHAAHRLYSPSRAQFKPILEHLGLPTDLPPLHPPAVRPMNHSTSTRARTTTQRPRAGARVRIRPTRKLVTRDNPL